MCPVNCSAGKLESRLPSLCRSTDGEFRRFISIFPPAEIDVPIYLRGTNPEHRETTREIRRQ